jgi:glyoxylase-like metal-dependent hydrolase (beta-lactamase superfamily II)
VIVETFAVGALGCNCTILGDPGSGEAIVIDGGDEVDEIARRLAAHGVRPRYLVHTHAHVDHIGALGPLRERVGGDGLLHHADLPLYGTLAQQARYLGMLAPPEVVALDGDLTDGDVLRAGAIALRCIHTPGHTPGSTSFALDGAGGSAGALLFTGDTLFSGAVGRWDLGGTSLADIVDSIRRKLLVHDDASVVVPGHGPATTIGRERRTNPYLV